MFVSSMCSREALITLATAIACTIAPAIASAQPASKSQSHNTEFAAVVHNACNQDDVAVTGKSHTRSDTDDSANKLRVRESTHNHGKGVGAFGTYQYQDMNDSYFETSAKSFVIEFQQKQHLIRDGKVKSAPKLGDDMFIKVRSVFRVQNGKVVKDEFKDSGVQCK
jgi:hypothetical protein